MFSMRHKLELTHLQCDTHYIQHNYFGLIPHSYIMRDPLLINQHLLTHFTAHNSTVSSCGLCVDFPLTFFSVQLLLNTYLDVFIFISISIYVYNYLYLHLFIFIRIYIYIRLSANYIPNNIIIRLSAIYVIDINIFRYIIECVVSCGNVVMLVRLKGVQIRCMCNICCCHEFISMFVCRMMSGTLLRKRVFLFRLSKTLARVEVSKRCCHSCFGKRSLRVGSNICQALQRGNAMYQWRTSKYWPL